MSLFKIGDLLGPISAQTLAAPDLCAALHTEYGEPALLRGEHRAMLTPHF